VLNITPGLNIDTAAALAIKKASVALRAAEDEALEADPGHGLPELEAMMGAHGSSTSASGAALGHSVGGGGGGVGGGGGGDRAHSDSDPEGDAYGEPEGDAWHNPWEDLDDNFFDAGPSSSDGRGKPPNTTRIS
jgi:hypothetical protein